MPSNQSSSAPITAHDSPSNRDILAAAKGSGIIFAGRIFEYASRFLFGIIIARAVGVDGYGLYGLVVAVATVLAGIAALGIPSGVVRFLPIALSERDEERVWGVLQVAIALVSALSLALSLLLFVLAGWTAVNLFHEPDAALALRIISVRVFLGAVAQVLKAGTRGFGRMEYQVYASSIVFNSSRIGLTVLALSFGFGVLGAVAAYVLAGAIEVILLIYFFNQLFPLRRPLHAAQRNVRELLSFSLPIGLSDILSMFSSNFQTVLLGMLATVAAVGVFNAALRLQMIGVMFLGAIQMVAMPIISSLYDRGDDVQLSRLYQTMTRWTLAFVLPFFVTIFLFAGPILRIFGKEFEVGASALVIMSLGTLVNAGTGICGAVLTMTGHTRLVFVNSVIELVVMVICDLLLIPVWGTAGAAMAFALSISIVNTARLLQVYWLHKLWPYDRTFVKPLVAGAGMLIVGLATSRLIPAGQNLLYLILNVVVLWMSFATAIAIQGLSEQDRAVLSHAKRRFSTGLARHRMLS